MREKGGAGPERPERVPGVSAGLGDSPRDPAGPLSPRVANAPADVSAPLARSAGFLVLALFTLSGAAGLVYEIVWTRLLTLVFGNTVYAASTVVASFMGGLAIGSYWFGRLADRRTDTLRLYGMLEAGVGLFALLLPLILRGLNVVYGGLFRAFGEEPAPFFVARFVLSFALLLLPTILMGATLPVLTRFFVVQRARLGGQVAKLYALNTIGATGGCFAAGFLLIERLGVKATNYAAAGTSLAVSATILLLARRSRAGAEGREEAGERPAGSGKRSSEPTPDATTPAAPGEARGGTLGGTLGGAGAASSSIARPSPARAESKGAARASVEYSDRLRRLILVAAALVGFTSLAYEVIWTRVIIYVVTASIEAFAVVLTTFLAGIALGSLIVSRWIDRWRRLLAVFGAIEIAIGLAAVASIPLLAHSYDFTNFLAPRVSQDFWGLTSMRFLVTALVIALPTLLMGAAFPVAVNGFIRARAGVGRGVGALYAMNTVGAVAGSLAAGFLVLPTIGAQRGLLVFALANLAVGVLLWSAEPGRRARGTVAAAAVAAAGFLPGVFLIPSNAFHRLFAESRPETEMIYCSEDVTATVTVHQYPPGYYFQDDVRVICTTGVDVAGTDYMLRTTQLLQGHLPLLFQKPGPRVMQVGFGSGETSRVVLLEGAQHLDVIEICEGLVRAAPLFADINKLAYQGPRARVIIMDAKNYALLTGETYDIIMNDSIHPRVSGNASLYTVDYFEDCRRHLPPGGLMSSWFPLFGLRLEELRMILHSFQTVFPHATLWMAYNMVNRHALLLAPVDDAPLRVDYRSFRERITAPEIQADLAVVDLNDPEFFLSSLVMDENALREFCEGASLNTDEHPLLEYSAPKYVANDDLAWAAVLASMLPYRSDVRPLLTDLPEDPGERQALDERLGRLYEANGHALRAMVEGLRNDPTSRDEFAAAELASPGHPAVRVALERQKNVLAQRIRAVMARPDDAGSVADLADAYWRAGRMEESAREMEKAARLAPDDPVVAKRLGDVLRSAGENRKAIDAYARSLALRPGNPDAIAGQAAALEADGETDEALARYREAASLGGKRSDLRVALGVAEERSGGTEEAEKAFRQALESSPQSVDALNHLALIVEGKGDREEATRLFRRAIAADPTDPDAWNDLAWIYAEDGTELDEALRLAERAVLLAPSATTYDTLAWVLFKQGDLARARETAVKALALSPDGETYREHLRMIEEAMGGTAGGPS